MKDEELTDAARPETVLASIEAHRDDLVAHDHGHGGPIETVRESTYKGRHILVRTTYSIEVDGKAIEGHLGVTNDGQVHYHAIPNLGFASTIELVEKLIDAFPDDFATSDHPDSPDHCGCDQHPGTDTPHHEHGKTCCHDKENTDCDHQHEGPLEPEHPAPHPPDEHEHPAPHGNGDPHHDHAEHEHGANGEHGAP